MRDAVDLIGKPIMVKETKYIISNINFLPTPARSGSYIWFELSVNGAILNYPYEDLLPYLQEQIKL
jgi:hypothetical protein